MLLLFVRLEGVFVAWSSLEFEISGIEICFGAKTMASNEVKFDVPLTQGFGYGIILGLGFAFALVMIFITWALKRYALL